MIPRSAGTKVSKQTSLQAPTEGLNARDPIANMKETEAVTMENFFPSPSSVDLRKGMTEHVGSLTGTVETLAFYNDGVDPKLFAVHSQGITDVTTAGTAISTGVSGLTNNRFQTINVGTAGGFFLMMVNGADKLQYYDGTNWTEDGGTYTITGVDTANCVHINNFKNRVWLIEKDSFRAWYLPVSAIAGTAASLNLSGLFKLGGYLMAMANWTIDNAAGIDDYAAFITSEGEVALYKGTDPSDSSAWALVGTFRMGKPIGRRCFCKAGADVLVLTTDGAFPLSKALLTDRSQGNLAATDKIKDLINADILSYQSVYGWQPIIYPTGRKLIINVPTTEGSESHQYVMNTTHGAWSKFTDWNATCWETLGDNLYFGGAGAVYQADTGNDDNGSNIQAVCQQAFSYFKSAGRIKKFQAARPVFIAEGEVTPAIVLNTDFKEDRTTVSPSFTGGGNAVWDSATWGVDSWSQGDAVTKKWQTVTGVGFAGGLRVVTETQGINIRWVATDFLYEEGGVF